MSQKEKIILIGGGGHCKSVIDIIETENKFQIAGILDLPEKVGKTILGYPIIGTDNDIPNIVKEYKNYQIAVGQIESPAKRIKLFNLIKENNAVLPVIISPFAHVAKSSVIKEGTIIMHHVIINADAQVGKNCIINNKALIEHEAVIEDNIHIATGAIINGACKVGKNCFIGSRAVLLHSTKICHNTIIGAGAIVTNDIVEKGVYVGCPAKKLSEMKKSDTVFLTTIYPESEKYLDDFFNSLQKQTCKDFDILVVNDGVNKFNVYSQNLKKLEIVEIISQKTPAKNRETGIKKALEFGYEFIIFGDSDDYFSNNRVHESKCALKKSGILINDLCLLSRNASNDSFITSAVKNTNTLQFNILNSNFFGFSNIAVQSKIIDPLIDFEDDLIAVDWYFISTLLLNQPIQVQFINDVKTYYRQHDNNTIGISVLLTEKKLDLGLQVKLSHYSALKKYCKRKKLEDYFLNYENKFKQIQKLKEALVNPLFKESYINVVNFNINYIFSGWWSEIITLEEFDFYENKNK